MADLYAQNGGTNIDNGPNSFTPEQLAQLQGMFMNDPSVQSLLTGLQDQQQNAINPGDRPGIRLTTPSKFERQAGAAVPYYEGTRDVTTGQLLDQYRQDPYAGDALQALKTQAFSQGQSPWAQMQTAQQKLEQEGAVDKAGKQAMQARSTAQSQLARQGGATGGASALLARSGARDLMNAQQDISKQGTQQRLAIGQQDIDRKNELLGKFGDLETSANTANIKTQTDDLTKSAAFDANRYNQQMQAWAAQQSANATRAAGGGGKK